MSRKTSKRRKAALTLEKTLKNFDIYSKPSTRPKRLKRVQEGKVLREAKKR